MGSPRPPPWVRAARLVLTVALLACAGGLSRGKPPDAGPPLSGEAPLPYVRGPSAWEYDSNFGRALVRLEEHGVRGGVRTYTWSLVIGPMRAGMTEVLHLSAAGLFVAVREFHLAGVPLVRFRFDTPELVIPAPLQTGQRWRASSTVRGPDGDGLTTVDGEVLAREPVEVPAGRFLAYRIHLTRRDSWGGVVETLMWLDPEVGVVKADGWFRWHGAIGALQRALSLDRLRVELVVARVRRTAEATSRSLPPPAAAGLPPPAGG